MEAKEELMTKIVGDVVRSLRGAPIFSFYVVATVIASTVIGLMAVDIVDLGFDHFGEVSHRTHDVAYLLLFSTMVVGVVAQLRRPERNVAAMAMAIVPAATLLLAAVLADQMDRVFRFHPLRYPAAVAVVAALLHPTGRAFFRTFRLSRTSGPMLALVGAAAAPLVGFVSSNITLQRTVVDEHRFIGHYGFMAALSCTIIGLGLLASLRPAGWRLTACVAGLLTTVLGGTSILYPDSVSSLDTAWAVAAIAWGAAFIAVAARTTDPTPQLFHLDADHEHRAPAPVT